jgi:hypothetical protein
VRTRLRSGNMLLPMEEFTNIIKMGTAEIPLTLLNKI